MKLLAYLFILVTFGLFIYSATNLVHDYNNYKVFALRDLKGFESSNEDQYFTTVAQKYQNKIEQETATVNDDQNYYFLCSFLVTALTAGATLVSAIHAAKRGKEKTGFSTTAAIWVASLAFCSTLANSLSNHFNQVKTEATKSLTSTIALRDQFFNDYSNAPDAKKHMTIFTYEKKLD